MKAIDWVVSGGTIFTVMSLVVVARFYWIAIFIVASVAFIGWHYHALGWFSMLYGIGAVVVCVAISSALATTGILFLIVSLNSCDEDDDE